MLEKQLAAQAAKLIKALGSEEEVEDIKEKVKENMHKYVDKEVDRIFDNNK